MFSVLNHRCAWETIQALSLIQSWNCIRPRDKTFFMLNSTEHEISLGHKNKNTKKRKNYHAELS